MNSWRRAFSVMKKPISVDRLVNEVERRVPNTISEVHANDTDGPAKRLPVLAKSPNSSF